MESAEEARAPNFKHTTSRTDDGDGVLRVKRQSSLHISLLAKMDAPPPDGLAEAGPDPLHFSEAETQAHRTAGHARHARRAEAAGDEPATPSRGLGGPPAAKQRPSTDRDSGRQAVLRGLRALVHVRRAPPAQLDVSLKETLALAELYYYLQRDQVDKARNHVRRERLNLNSTRTADADGRTPLHVAAGAGAVAAVRWLLEAAVAVNALDRFFRTPLRDAADAAHVEVAAGAMVHGSERASERHDNNPHNASVYKGAAAAAALGAGMQPLRAVEPDAVWPTDPAARKATASASGSPGQGDGETMTGGDASLTPADTTDHNMASIIARAHEWEIDPATLRIADSPLATGSFGAVFRATWRGAPVVVKRLKPEFAEDAGALEELRAELAVWCRLHHPHILHFLGAVTAAPGCPPTLVAELCDRGSLHTVLQRNHAEGRRLRFEDALRYAAGIAAGMFYLHSREPVAVMHRDLKPANCLIDGQGAIRIGDFGLSKMLLVHARRVDRSGPAAAAGAPAAADLDSSVHGHAAGGAPDGGGGAPSLPPVDLQDKRFFLSGETGSYKYMAPEVYRHERYSLKCDVFSFAVIAFELFEAPLVVADSAKHIKAVAGPHNYRPAFNVLPSVNEKRALEAERIIREERLGRDRPTFADVCARLERVAGMRASEKLDGPRPEWSRMGPAGVGPEPLSAAEPKTPTGGLC